MKDADRDAMRCAIDKTLFMSIFVFVAISCIATAEASHRSYIVDPVLPAGRQGRHIVIDIPEGDWSVEEFYGDGALRVIGSYGAEVVIRRDESGGHVSGTSNKMVTVDGVSIEFSCSGREEDELSALFMCKDMAGRVRAIDNSKAVAGGSEKIDIYSGISIPSPSLLKHLRDQLVRFPTSLDAQASYAMAMGIYAFLDGRSGCHQIYDDVNDMAPIAKRAGKSEISKKLQLVAKLLNREICVEKIKNVDKILKEFYDDGSIDSDLGSLIRALAMESEGRQIFARQVYEHLKKKGEAFFPSLYLQRSDLLSGHMHRAQSTPASAVGDSSLAKALKVWVATEDGDSQTIAEFEKDIDGWACGTSGALAYHRLGLFYANRDTTRASGYLKKSIAADPSSVAPYLSLGMILLEGGEDAFGAADEILSLLDRAPETAEILKLKDRLSSMDAITKVSDAF